MIPSELMLGNCISFKGLWVGKLSSIKSSGIVEIEGNKGLFELDDFKPVYVTRELLFKIGAEDFHDGESISFKNRLIGYAECRNEFYDKSSFVPLKHLHQLQNFMHSQTGTELEIDLSKIK